MALLYPQDRPGRHRVRKAIEAINMLLAERTDVYLNPFVPSSRSDCYYTTCSPQTCRFLEKEAFLTVAAIRAVHAVEISFAESRVEGKNRHLILIQPSRQPRQ